jgi:hypothetical protein
MGKHAPVLGGLFGTVAGAVVGVVAGPLIVAFPGTVLGSIAGFIGGRTLYLLGLKRAGGIRGGLLGSGLGGIAYGWFMAETREEAQFGLLSGAIIGGVVGIVLVLMFFVSLMLIELRRNEPEER